MLYDLVLGYQNLRGSCCTNLMGRSEEEAMWDKKVMVVKKGGPGPGLRANQQEALALKTASCISRQPICKLPCPS